VGRLYPDLVLLGDPLEWRAWGGRGDPVLHVLLKDWADLLLLAPASANTMAKLATGACPDLLSCVARAWPVGAPFLYCPAMNTDMWLHPVTVRHLRTLQEFGYEQLPPVEKRLMCGAVGHGAMAEWEEVVAAALERLGLPRRHI